MSRFMRIGDSFVRPSTVRCIRVVGAIAATQFSAGHPPRVLVHHGEPASRSAFGLGFGGPAEHIEIVRCESYEEAVELAERLHDEIAGAVGREVAS